jgi:hypothetical protein
MKTRALIVLLAASGVAACDSRLDPLSGRTPRPPITAPSGTFDLREVDDEPLPHETTNGGTTYSLVAATFSLNTDSTWLFSTTEVLTSNNTGQVIGTSPANYQGTWRVSDTTINLLPNYGRVTVKGDSLFWRGGPKHSWEPELKFTLLKR